MTRRIPLGVATPELRVVLACRDRPCVGTDAAVWSSDRGPGGPKTPETCPSCGASASLPLGVTCADHHPQEVWA